MKRSSGRKRASQKSRTKKKRRKQAVVERSPSQINYDHWWRKHPYWNKSDTFCIDEQKAAVFYEAYRRCPALQDPWLKGTTGAKAMAQFGWQMFAATVLNYLPKTWIELSPHVRKQIVTNQLPAMLPPVGYSVWPVEPFFHDRQAIPPQDKSESLKEYNERWRPETREQYHERCRDLAAKIIQIPLVRLRDASQLLHELRTLAENGFVIAAIDHKSAEALNYAIQFLQRNLRGKRSYRIADLFWQWPQKADAKIEDYEGIQRIWAELRAVGKRVKKDKGRGVIAEEKVFRFQELCKGLESYDKTGTLSDLMKRLRLGYKESR